MSNKDNYGLVAPNESYSVYGPKTRNNSIKNSIYELKKANKNKYNKFTK